MVLFTADELAVCSHESGTATGVSTGAGTFVLFVGGVGAAVLAVAGIVAVVRARRRGTEPRPSRLWILLAALLFVPAGLATLLAVVSGFFACPSGFF